VSNAAGRHRGVPAPERSSLVKELKVVAPKTEIVTKDLKVNVQLTNEGRTQVEAYRHLEDLISRWLHDCLGSLAQGPEDMKLLTRAARKLRGLAGLVPPRKARRRKG
jgi:hypothetical protein